MRIGVVLMASGEGRRFGENKLLHPFMGKPLCQRAMDAIPCAAVERVTVVTAYDEIEAEAKRRGFDTVRNPDPALGGSHTVKLGVERLADMDALMFCVCDQPLLRRDSVVGLVDCYMQNPDNIVALGHDQKRGNPVIFPRAYYGELMALTGNNGGTAVIRAHPEALVCYDIQDERELWDVDTAADLVRLEEEYSSL